jgi:small conductance mechanosensitive channel
MNNRSLKSIPAFLLLIAALSFSLITRGEADTELVEADTEIEEVAAELTPGEELIVEADLIDQAILGIGELIRELEASILDASGENREVLELERQRQALKILNHLFELTENLHQQTALGNDTDAFRKTIVSYLLRTSSSLDEYIDKEMDDLVVHRSGVSELKGVQLIGFERRIANDLKWVQELLSAKSDTIEELKVLDIPVQTHRENLTQRLKALIAKLSGELRLVSGQLATINESASVEPLTSGSKSELQALEIRQRAIFQTSSLVLGMLDENGVDTAEFRQLLLESGGVSADIFNPRIMLTLLTNQADLLLDGLKTNAGSFLTHLVIFIFILTAFNLIAKVVSYMITRGFESNRAGVSHLMQDMLLALSSRGIMLLGLLVALGQMGFEITALLTGLGIAGFIVGFALQDSLANFVAGLMILAYRPYDVGDVIESCGVIGKVSKMSLVSTTILTFDNQTLIVPNNKIWGDVIKNITLQKNRRIDLEFNIGLDEDVEKAKTVIREYIESHGQILRDPVPSIEFDRITTYSLVIIVRPWVERSEYWAIRWEILQQIKERLDQAGIKRPVVSQSIVAPA